MLELSRKTQESHYAGEICPSMLVDGEAAASVKNIQYFLEYIEPPGGRQHSHYHEV